VVVATDGSCLNNGEENAAAGSGIFFDTDNPRNLRIRVPGDWPQTNQTGELLAIKAAVESVPDNRHLVIESDSLTMIKSLTNNKSAQEDRGYLDTDNAPLLKHTIALLRKRSARTTFLWVKGHSGHIRNEGADSQANDGAHLPLTEARPIPIPIPDKVKLTGMRLSQLTQSRAYKGILRARRGRDTPYVASERRRTKLNLDRIRADVGEKLNYLPTDRNIWRQVRHKDHSKKQAYFAWMALHEAYRIGDHWSERRGYSRELSLREYCGHCENETESLEHIICDCTTPGQNDIWELAGNLWQLKNSHMTWDKPGIGGVLGSAIAPLKKSDGSPDPGSSRLYRILVMESAHLIWKLRCERVVSRDNESFSPQEVASRWYRAISERMKLDVSLCHPCWDKQQMSRRIMKRTWIELLDNPEVRPSEWESRPLGGLVGRRPIARRCRPG